MIRRASPRLPVLWLLAAFTAVWSGCSGESDDDDSSTSPTPPPIVLEPASLPSGQERAAYSAQLEAGGGVPPYRFDVISGAIPFGLRLDAGSGAFTGTPSLAGSYSFEVRVLDAVGQSDVESYSVLVSRWNTPVQIGCGGASTTTLSASAYRQNDDVYEFQSEAEVTFYEVLLPPPGTTVLTLTATSPDGDPALFVGRVGQPVGSELTAYYTVRGVSAGDEEVRLHGESTPPLVNYLNYGGSIAVVVAATTPGAMTLRMNCGSGPVLVDPFLPNASVGEPYQAALTAISGTPPYAFSSPADLPQGLSLSPDGVVSGVPVAPGAFEVRIDVTDSLGASESRVLSLWVPEIVRVACGMSETFSFSTWAFNGQQGLATQGGAAFVALEIPDGTSAVELELVHEGDFSVGLFQGAPGRSAGSSRDEDYVDVVFDSPGSDPDPVGLTLDSSSLPSLAEYGTEAALALGARDGFGDATLTVGCRSEVEVETVFLPNGAVGAPYVSELDAMGGSGPFSWNVTGLPPGVVLGTDGSLTGVPLTAGRYTPWSTVTDGSGASASRGFVLSIGETGASAACGQTAPITCDDVAAGSLTAVAWTDRVEVDLTRPGAAAFFCLEFLPGSEVVDVVVENYSGDADLFIGYPGMTPGDTDDAHYWYFSSLGGDDALRLDDSRYPPLSAYDGLAGVAVAAYEPGQFLISIECD